MFISLQCAFVERSRLHSLHCSFGAIASDLRAASYIAHGATCSRHCLKCRHRVIGTRGASPVSPRVDVRRSGYCRALVVSVRVDACAACVSYCKEQTRVPRPLRRFFVRTRTVVLRLEQKQRHYIRSQAARAPNGSDVIALTSQRVNLAVARLVCCVFPLSNHGNERFENLGPCWRKYA